MTDNIRISVVIPCYNCANTLQRCIDHFIGGSFNEALELILVDDGSTDQTGTLCDKYDSKYDNVRTIHQDNKGLVCAWKTGVASAKGKYIVFCDSDDYVDEDYPDKIIGLLDDHDVDIVAYGMSIEYDDGRTDRVCNKAESGTYADIGLENIRNRLLFNGGMQSELFLNSRCSKVFRTELLRNTMDVINNDLTYGEDAVTTFAAVMAADSILCINDWFPYHYLRNEQSMIGKYDPQWFDRIKTLYNGLKRVSETTCRSQCDIQTDNFFFSWVLLYAKKEICRNPKGMKEIRSYLDKVRNDEYLLSALEHVDISGYNIASKVFAELFINRLYTTMIMAVKCAEALNYGRP